MGIHLKKINQILSIFDKKIHFPNMKKILSIDGGGIRGIIPAVILADIEHRTKKPISKLFDIIAGTSTGGILALGLVMPDDTYPDKPAQTAQEMIKMYKNEGRKIFPPSFLDSLGLAGWSGEKYGEKGIEGVLEERFADTRLSQALCDTIITSYEIEKRENVIFKSTTAQLEHEEDFYMRDIARATSAAPTYFEPAKIQAINKQNSYYLVDGGLFANNPAMYAYTHFIENVKGRENKECIMVSLGTGNVFKPILYKKAINWGLIGWAKPTIDILFDGICNAIDEQLRVIFKARKNSRYYRFQRELQNEYNELDDTKEETINYLIGLAERLVDEKKEVIEQLCERLVK